MLKRSGIHIMIGARMTKKLDNLDLKIINILQDDGRASITELAKKVESSRPTVTNRLKKLMDDELVTIKGGLNLIKIGFKMACIGLEIINDDTRKEVEHHLRNCPRVLSISRIPEKANIHINMWGEDDHTINSTIESFRDIPNVDIIYTHYLGTPIHGNILINLEPGKEGDAACGKICSNCHRYNKAWCLGCPLTTYYKNPILE